uniref:Pentraxin (PTX) domain-containing protein n=1 Tax=Periophthalmus magnuspinnatus TaxID=409849 RepID=A0A3B4ARY0_9GOBI
IVLLVLWYMYTWAPVYFVCISKDMTGKMLVFPQETNTVRGKIFNFDIKNTVRNFKGQDYQLNRWQSVCGTWDAASGLVQLWVDGKPSSMKFSTESNISGPMIIVLGMIDTTYGSHGSMELNLAIVHLFNYRCAKYPNDVHSYCEGGLPFHRADM